MARDPKKRQQKLEKRAKKRKEKKLIQRREQAQGLAAQLTEAQGTPIRDCLVQSSLEDEGIGSLLVSRTLSDGRVAFGNFLIDRYCLGVKDAFGRVVTVGEYREFLDRFEQVGHLEPLDPPSARRLVDDAVDYARQFGISPHPDYAKARPILGDIDPTDPIRTYEMGKDGQPFYVAGPNETAADSRQIINLLHRACGPGGYHYLAGGDEADLAGLIDDEPFDDEPFDDEFFDDGSSEVRRIETDEP